MYSQCFISLKRHWNSFKKLQHQHQPSLEKCFVLHNIHVTFWTDIRQTSSEAPCFVLFCAFFLKTGYYREILICACVSLVPTSINLENSKFTIGVFSSCNNFELDRTSNRDFQMDFNDDQQFLPSFTMKMRDNKLKYYYIYNLLQKESLETLTYNHILNGGFWTDVTLKFDVTLKISSVVNRAKSIY